MLQWGKDQLSRWLFRKYYDWYGIVGWYLPNEEGKNFSYAVGFAFSFWGEKPGIGEVRNYVVKAAHLASGSAGAAGLQSADER
eukprot:scaffold880_cov81-Skeletonema_marinoi.AAC.1